MTKATIQRRLLELESRQGHAAVPVGLGHFREQENADTPTGRELRASLRHFYGGNLPDDDKLKMQE